MAGRQLRETFDSVAELYERIRPGYPAALFDDLADVSGLTPASSSVVEIGCGTGQATRTLAARGYTVTAVELGPALAAVARRVLAGHDRVEVLTADFDTWDPDRTVDLVFSSTAWHWLAVPDCYDKAATVLRPGGWLAIVGTHHVFPEDGDPFFHDIQYAYDAIGDGLGDKSLPRPEDVDDVSLSGEIERSGRFERPTVLRYLWDETYTAEGYVDLVSTYSSLIALDADRQSYLLGEMRRLLAARPDGRVRKTYLNTLHLARQVAA